MAFWANMQKAKSAEPSANRYRHLSVRIRADVYKHARTAAIMTDMRFALFVERALVIMMDSLKEPAP